MQHFLNLTSTNHTKFETQRKEEEGRRNNEGRKEGRSVNLPNYRRASKPELKSEEEGSPLPRAQRGGRDSSRVVQPRFENGKREAEPESDGV
ncbi:uncharacterized protein G2W53_017750 [Senna tora]|uniref:Uncharacterized protein n=1 Tax=Senna tora TaxID=362788 RepID=A0A834TTE3_9FABA|nr:uncharacterized protein G2W53_017750 [Senna tora]